MKEFRGGGGTADTHASGACARTGVRVQIPSSASFRTSDRVSFAWWTQVLSSLCCLVTNPKLISNHLPCLSRLQSKLWLRRLDSIHRPFSFDSLRLVRWIQVQSLIGCLIITSAMLERWPSLVRHRTRNPASGLRSHAGSNPVLSLIAIY